jgi:hypothetical protein
MILKRTVLVIMIFLCLLSLAWAHPKFLSPEYYPTYETNSNRADSLHGFDVQKYTITLTINDIAHSISGNVVANVLATSNLDAIDYNLVGLNVSQVLVNDVSNAYTYTGGIVHIPLTGITNGTLFNTKVVYSGTPVLSADVYHIGMIFSSTTVFTLSDPDASRNWWPCYDHPWDKAIVDLHITMRGDWLVACNGIRESTVDNGDGTKTTNWIGSNPMSPYLACVTASNYREIDQTYGDMPIMNFVSNAQYNNALVDFASLPTMISVFSQKYGPYPFEKYGNTVVNMTTFGAMEHQTMTTMGTNYITGNQAGQYGIAHELSHQWYGNCLTPLTFMDVWLSEGFATYSEAVWEESQHGFNSMCSYVESYFHNYYLSWESSSNPATIYNPSFSTYFNPQSYQKSASVLHMLRLQVGEANFWSIMQSWFTAHHNGNIITEEFEILCETISGQDLHQFFQQWIYSAGIPSIEYANFYSLDSGIPQIKVYAKTSCQSGGNFYMKVPMQVLYPVNRDSILVDAVPHPVNPTPHGVATSEPEDIVIQADPNHWLLQRGLTAVVPSQPQAFAANNCVYLTWEPFWNEVPVSGYIVYRATVGEEFITQLNQVPISNLHFLDTTALNGITYGYSIRAVTTDEFASDYSPSVSATPTTFTMNQGVLVIDETRDGTGSAISPTDAMVDDFYNTVLSNVIHTNYDYNVSGTPTLELLSNYSTVLYHDDDFSTHHIQDVTDILGSYVIGGGNLIISGWKTAGQIPTTFLDIFFPGIQVNYDGTPDFISTQSTIYPNLILNPDKLSSTWNGHLTMINTFTNVTNPIYTGNFIEGSSYQGQAVAIRTQQNGEFILLGIPLYVMMEDDVRGFLLQLLQEIDPAVPNEDVTQPQANMSLSIFPNPFSSSTSLQYSLPKSGKVELTIYNIRGQKVRTIFKEEIRSGENIITWNGLDDLGNHVANGVYFCRMETNRQKITKRLLLIK